MKRSSLARKTPLRRKPLEAPVDRLLRPPAARSGESRGKANPPRPVTVEPRVGRRAWYAFPKWGRCEACGKSGRREAHHIVRSSDVMRLAPGRFYDLNNRWILGAQCCHPNHHSYGVNDTRLRLSQVPDCARVFAADIFGSAERAADYFARRYRS